MRKVMLYTGDELAAYGFGDGHPFGPDRQAAFLGQARRRGLDSLTQPGRPVRADDSTLTAFHTREHVDFVRRRCAENEGFLDDGDTPARAGLDVAAEWVVGTTAAAVDSIMDGTVDRAMVPIGGLHHAARGNAAGFCIYNDCGVAIERLLHRHHLLRVAYVDIDAHHGDGVYYAFESDPAVIFADIHEDGRFLYPGTGAAEEVGVGAAAGTKLNLPLPPGAGDEAFRVAWDTVEQFLDDHAPEFIILQCGADSLAGDPITHLAFTEAAHAHAARSLCRLADKHAGGRVLALGGGGYDRPNIGLAWSAVLQELVEP
jgi:acetoin utilization protein AcuC